MDTKFIITIVLSIFSLALYNCIVPEKTKSITTDNVIHIQLSSNIDNCSYDNDRVVITVKFENNNFFPILINRNMPVTTKDIQVKGIIKINIFHNENLFEYAYWDGKEAMQKKYFLFKEKSLEVNDILKFRQLSKKNELKKTDNISKTQINNVDFGIYQLQALYISKSNDTLFSNKITINYLK